MISEREFRKIKYRLIRYFNGKFLRRNGDGFMTGDLVIGDGTADTDYKITFDGEDSDGELVWMEDEDYFKFSDDIFIPVNERIYFRDADISVYSGFDGYLTIDANAGLDVNGRYIDFGDGTNDVVLYFTGGNTGQLTWMEDEEYFKFHDDVLMNADEKLYFRDTDISINSSADGQLDIDADTEVEITTTDLDINADVDISGEVVLGDILVGSVDEITATSDGVAASVETLCTEVTTNGDQDLDNVTLANGSSGQIKNIYCVVVGDAADTWKITPANMVGGTQITFSGAGEGCTLVYADSEGWVVVANNGGSIT